METRLDDAAEPCLRKSPFSAKAYRLPAALEQALLSCRSEAGRAGE
jgi:hypothetical protein